MWAFCMVLRRCATTMVDLLVAASAPLQRLLLHHLPLCIQCACPLIQQQDLRITHHRSILVVNDTFPLVYRSGACSHISVQHNKLQPIFLHRTSSRCKYCYFASAYHLGIFRQCKWGGGIWIPTIECFERAYLSRRLRQTHTSIEGTLPPPSKCSPLSLSQVSFQCRNLLVLRDEAALAATNAAAAASNFGSYADGGDGSSCRKDRTHGKRHREDASRRGVSDLSSEEDESSETNENLSSEDSEMERAVAAKYGKNVLNTLAKKGKSTHKEQSKHKRSHSKRSKGRREVSSGDDSIASSEEDLKKVKHRSRWKRGCKDVSDSRWDEEASDSESEEQRRRKRRHSHKHSKSRSKHTSKHSDESSEVEGTKQSRKKGSSRQQHADRKHG